MPLRSFTFEECLQNRRSNSESVWPDGGTPAGHRLGRFAQVSCEPSFAINDSDAIMTIGSCFAREIEAALSEYGFELPALAVELPEAERGGSIANNLQNKYVVQSMENEIRWAFEDHGFPPETYFLRTGDELWHDPHLVHNLVPANLERVIERSQMVRSVMARLPECQVVVLTLGLVEAWFDTVTGLYLNGMPPRFSLRAEPDRFRLDVLDYNEILASLERIYALLENHGHPDFRVLVSISPVPFKVTFTGQDAISANTYGKAVQRAAAEVFTSRHDRVDYFPSFEMVMLSERQAAYWKDNIHVDTPMVESIVSTMLNAYVPQRG